MGWEEFAVYPNLWARLRNRRVILSQCYNGAWVVPMPALPTVAPGKGEGKAAAKGKGEAAAILPPDVGMLPFPKALGGKGDAVAIQPVAREPQPDYRIAAGRRGEAGAGNAEAMPAERIQRDHRIAAGGEAGAVEAVEEPIDGAAPSPVGRARFLEPEMDQQEAEQAAEGAMSNVDGGAVDGEREAMLGSDLAAGLPITRLAPGVGEPSASHPPVASMSSPGSSADVAAGRVEQ